ncbi:MAG: hypothetical protein JHC95_12740 [Solirubrobacteraceae bacterium]|nr:hypothetical protein [Solirubrobacteraceae bacterium]
MSLRRALTEAGGVEAPKTRGAWLHELLVGELREGAHELTQARSGKDKPVVVAFASGEGMLLAATPIDAKLRADPAVVTDREWLLTAAAVGTLIDVVGPPPPAAISDLQLMCGELDGFLVLAYPQEDPEPELAVYAFEEQAAEIDRLRTSPSALPTNAFKGAQESLSPPVGAVHPLRVAEAIARFGGRPADHHDDAANDDAVLALFEGHGGVSRPHDDPDPARRVARRILQRLAGMGKWGGYHTEFAHLARGFAGNDRELAERVGEALLQADLLQEKPSVGQRHVYLNPRRAADIYAFVERGEVPQNVSLP